MSQTHYFATVNEQLFGILNYEQQVLGSSACVFYPIREGRLDIYSKLKAKGWTDEAIHERLFPQSHLRGKWTRFCRHLDAQQEQYSLSELMTWSKHELADFIRDRIGAPLPTLQHVGKRDLAVLVQAMQPAEHNDLSQAS